MQRNFASIQCLRAIAALSVVTAHIGAVERLYGGGYAFMPGWGVYGVDLFFVISGFVMVWTSHARFGHPRAALPFMLHRIARIYPVYWQFTVVIIVAMLLSPQSLNSSAGNQPDTVKSLLLWPQTMDPLLGVGWTLVFEMYFYSVFCLAFVLPRSLSLGIFAAWTLLLLLSPFLSLSSDSAELRLILSPLALEFLMGVAAAYGFIRRMYLPPPVLLACAIAIITALIFVEPMLTPYARVGWIGIPCLMTVYALLWLEEQGIPHFPSWLRRIGDASYSLYLSHFLLLSALGKFWKMLGLQGLAAHIAFVAFCPLAAIALALLNYRWVEQPVSHYLRQKLRLVTKR